MSYSRKSSQVRAISNTVVSACKTMNLRIVAQEHAGWSASNYIFVDFNENEAPLKIRISDHDPRFNDNDVCIFVYDRDVWGRDENTRKSVIAGIEKIAYLAQVIVPEKFKAAGFEKRSASAEKAAIARCRKKNDLESEMTASVVAELRNERLCSMPTAGKVVDRLFPKIPRAQRQRLAGSASYAVKKERGI